MTTVEINNPTVEAFLFKKAKVENIQVNEYLSNIILHEMEADAVKNDLTQMEKEIKQVNNGTIKLKTAHSLLDEL